MSVYIEGLVDCVALKNPEEMGVGDQVGGTLCIRVGSPCPSTSTVMTLDTQHTGTTLDMTALEEDLVDSEDEVGRQTARVLRSRIEELFVL